MVGIQIVNISLFFIPLKSASAIIISNPEKHELLVGNKTEFHEILNQN